ncbi:MAG: cytochrome c [Pseudomonadota bacterium]
MAFARLSQVTLCAGGALSAATLALAVAGTFALATEARAQDERPFDNQIRARQGLMRVQAVNLGVLAGMVRGRTEYDAEAAEVAAANLAASGLIDQRFFWPEGSSVSDVEGTSALPEIWSDYDAFLEKWASFTEATETLIDVAGNGQEALGQGLSAVGRSCGTCHESYQLSE